MKTQKDDFWIQVKIKARNYCNKLAKEIYKSADYHYRLQTEYKAYLAGAHMGWRLKDKILTGSGPRSKP